MSPTPPRLIIIESPYAGDVERNTRYARACLADSLSRGEAPLASHLLYTQPGVLDDRAPEEREQGIASGLAWALISEATIVYLDLGISVGMQRGIDHAMAHDRRLEYRVLGGEWASHLADSNLLA